jgi:hypothetical protein
VGGPGFWICGQAWVQVCRDLPDTMAGLEPECLGSCLVLGRTWPWTHKDGSYFESVGTGLASWSPGFGLELGSARWAWIIGPKGWAWVLGLWGKHATGWAWSPPVFFFRLYHLSHTSSPFCSGYFRDGVSWTVCLGCPQIAILLISASQVTRITGVSHWCPVLIVSWKLSMICLQNFPFLPNCYLP